MELKRILFQNRSNNKFERIKIPAFFYQRKLMLPQTAQDHFNRDKKNPANAGFYFYPPKSSNLMFSSGIPKSSSNFKTAAFINGGPHK